MSALIGELEFWALVVFLSVGAAFVTKKGEPSPLAKAPPIPPSFPSRLRAIRK